MTFKSLLNAVLYACGEDPSKPALMGVYFKQSPEGKWQLMACDGFRLAFAEADVGLGELTECVLSSFALQKLSKMLGPKDSVYFSESEDTPPGYIGALITGKGGSMKVYVRKISEEYPYSGFKVCVPITTQFSRSIDKKEPLLFVDPKLLKQAFKSFGEEVLWVAQGLEPDQPVYLYHENHPGQMAVIMPLRSE